MQPTEQKPDVNYYLVTLRRSASGAWKPGVDEGYDPFPDGWMTEYLRSPACEELRGRLSTTTENIVQVHWSFPEVCSYLSREKERRVSLTAYQQYAILTLLMSVPGESLLDLGVFESYTAIGKKLGSSGRYLSESQKQELYHLTACQEGCPLKEEA